MIKRYLVSRDGKLVESGEGIVVKYEDYKEIYDKYVELLELKIPQLTTTQPMSLGPRNPNRLDIRFDNQGIVDG
jgi:hypothetical protein